MEEKKRTVDQRKKASIDDIETFAKQLGQVDYLKPHCDLLLGWANEARNGSKSVDDILEFINDYRKKLRAIMGGLLVAFETLEGDDLAQAIVSLFPPKEEPKAPNRTMTWKPREPKAPNKNQVIETPTKQKAFWD